MRGKWVVSYQEYLKFEGVKQNLKELKAKRKGVMRMKKNISGYEVEDTIVRLLSKARNLTVSGTDAFTDIGFGADARVAYMEEDKNYSFYIDVTMKDKEHVQYFTLSGDLIDDMDKAFAYHTEDFTVRFGIKYQHAYHFFYEKPIVVVHISNYVRCHDIAAPHLNNIAQVMMSLNHMLVEQGYGARASKQVRPNIRRHHEEYRRSINKEEN